MKINWKVRFKNPVFWMTIIPAVVTCVYTILACFGITPGVSEDSLINSITAVITTLSTLGVLVDPTTKGLKDGALGITYTEPQ